MHAWIRKQQWQQQNTNIRTNNNKKKEGNANNVTTVTVYTTLFMHFLLLEDVHCDMFRFSFEPSSGNMHAGM
jgi:hypothetical protein